MSTTAISVLIPIVTCIAGLAGSVAVLYRKLKKSIGNLFIKDENGKITKFKFFEFINIVMMAVATAEATGKKGAEKKEIAVATIQATLDGMNVNYDIKELSGTIDTLITLINAFVKKSKK